MRTGFGLSEALALMTDTKFIGHRVSNRDVRKVFFLSRMCVIDEYRERLKFTTLDFVEFLEFVARSGGGSLRVLPTPPPTPAHAARSSRHCTKNLRPEKPPPPLPYWVQDSPTSCRSPRMPTWKKSGCRTW